MNNEQFTLVKLPLRVLIKNNYIVSISEDDELYSEYIIKQANSPMFDQIMQLRGKYSSHISEMILVVAKKNPKLESNLTYILENGFIFNGKHYARFGKSASQGKDGITAFVVDDIFDELYMITKMDIEIDECVISKYESQRCLPFSSCTLVENYIPNVVIIDEYTKTLNGKLIRYVAEKQREFINPETGEIKKYNAKEIEEGYHDVNLSPFDGCGCHEIEFMEKTSQALGLDYNAIGNQIRLPFIKGYSVYVPFRKILKEWGYNTITDIYGNTHNVDDVDCIWNISMFKGHKLFKSKYGSEAWCEYIKTLKKFKFKLGISKYSHHVKNLNLKARMNFQYLQCLDLWNQKYIDAYNMKNMKDYDILDEKNEGKIISIAKYTTSLFEKIIKGDKFYTYKFMGINETDNYVPNGKYLEAALINDVMLKDPAVKQFVYQKLKKSINEAKIGKIYADGFYHTVVGDMIGYLQYAVGIEPTGCLKEKEFYARTLKLGKVFSFRSPLVDPSEVNDVKLVSNEITEKWFGEFENQDVVMLNMYDLSLPQQGGMDCDGDAVFLCDNPVVINSKFDKPIVIDIDDKSLAKPKPYTKDNIVKYELMTRDNRIGEITNVATSIINKYTTNEKMSKIYSDQLSLLRLYQGKEIDFIKTGTRWHMSNSLRKHLKQLPWFLLHNYPNKLKLYESIRAKNKKIENKNDKYRLNAYHSPSPMNELCEYVCEWEKKHILWDNSVVDTRCLILNADIDISDKKIRKVIRHFVNKYADDVRRYVNGLNILELDDYDTEFDIEILQNHYKNKISESIKLDEEVIANYVIDVSYSNPSISKSLAWGVYGDYIIKNLNENSNPKRNVVIEEVKYKTSDSYEWLGKYYTMKENG